MKSYLAGVGTIWTVLTLALQSCTTMPGAGAASIASYNPAKPGEEGIFAFPKDAEMGFRVRSVTLQKKTKIKSGGGRPAEEFGATIYFYGKPFKVGGDRNLEGVKSVVVHCWDGAKDDYRHLLWMPEQGIVDIRLHMKHFNEILDIVNSGARVNIVVGPEISGAHTVYFHEVGKKIPTPDDPHVNP